MTMSNRKFSNKFTLIVGALGLFLAHSMNAASMADVKAFGAKGDTNVILDASVDKGSNILATHSYQFTPADIGKRIIVVGAGVSGSNLVTDISSVLDPNDVTLRAMAFSAVSEANAYWGTRRLRCYREGTSINFNHWWYAIFSDRHLFEPKPYSPPKFDYDARPGARLVDFGRSGRDSTSSGQ